MVVERSSLWTTLRAQALPLLVGIGVFTLLWQPVRTWLKSEQSYDETALQEWLDEARGFRETLPGMVDNYLLRARHHAELQRQMQAGTIGAEGLGSLIHAQEQMVIEREKIQEHLEALGNPPTKMYSGQLPLFPIIYRIEVDFDLPGEVPIVWDSELPSHPSQYRELEHRVHKDALVKLRYQLHAYNQRQRDEEMRNARLRQLGVVAILILVVFGVWIYLAQRREGERERQQMLASYQVEQAERQLLQEELRRQEAEQRQKEAERDLLAQKLSAQESESKLLEMRSQVYASIGIMAGSYAHNIKNLLVRPNDLLARCLEVDGLSQEQAHMLNEVRHTLGTVTERLQQILRTVRRDPTRSEMIVVDLGQLLVDLQQTWTDLARDKWKMQLTLELGEGPFHLHGDLSHLQQAIENLLFNARDATFEMRNHLREEARRADLDPGQRRQALIAAAAWKGQVWIRGYRHNDSLVIEVRDNGIGMTEEVRRRCTETHFSTKRDNATYEGNTTGMGLGLSFVVAILEHHRAKLEIRSEPLQGATFTMLFPLAPGE